MKIEMREITALRVKGYSDGQIIDELCQRGYNEKKILKALAHKNRRPLQMPRWELVLFLMLAAVGGGLLVFFLAGDEPLVKDVVKIGVLLDFSSSEAGTGRSIQKALDMALDDAKTKGQLNKYDVELVYADGRCNGQLAADAGRHLIVEEQVVAIIGGLCSSETLALAPLANAHKIPIISPSSTSPLVSKAGDYVFRLAPSDINQAKAIVDYIEQENYQRVAVLYVSDAYGRGLYQAIREQLKGSAIVDLQLSDDLTPESILETYVEREVYTSSNFAIGEREFEVELKKIEDSQPDVIVLATHPEEAGFVLRKLQEDGFVVPIIGSEAVKSDVLFSIVSDKSYLEGLVVFVPSKEGNEQFTLFSEEFMGRYGQEPAIWSAEGYDALRLFLYAVNGGATTGEQIREFLLLPRTYQGPTGRIRFDPLGDITLVQYDALVVEDGKFIRK